MTHLCPLLAEQIFRHKVTGWTLKKETKTNEVVIIITFNRISTESSIDTVLCRPWSDEVEDYAEYKRIRKLYRDKQSEAMNSPLTALDPRTDSAFDGDGLSKT